MSVNDILDQIAAAEKIAEGRAGLQPWWTPIATKALGDALRDVNMILAGRRLTATQIQSWADYDSALLNQALYWCFTEGSALLANVPEEARNPDRFDMRKWLATAALLDAAGNTIQATSVGFGKITGGYADASSKNPSYPKGPFLDQEGGLRRW